MPVLRASMYGLAVCELHTDLDQGSKLMLESSSHCLQVVCSGVGCTCDRKQNLFLCTKVPSECFWCDNWSTQRGRNFQFI